MVDFKKYQLSLGVLIALYSLASTALIQKFYLVYFFNVILIYLYITYFIFINNKKYNNKKN